MTQPALSILIPSTPDRSESVNLLLKELERQCNGVRDIGVYNSNEQIFTHYFHNGVEATVYIDDKTLTIGEKRGELYLMSNGLFSWQIDSDDMIAPNAIDIILSYIQAKPDVDCISFREKCIIDGVYFPSNFSMKYEKWEDGVDGFAWVRNIFYKCVIRTEISRLVPFEKIRFGEDEKWAMALAPLLKREYHIDEELYYYIHNSTPHHERYGFDKDA